MAEDRDCPTAVTVLGKDLPFGALAGEVIELLTERDHDGAVIGVPPVLHVRACALNRDPLDFELAGAHSAACA